MKIDDLSIEKFFELTNQQHVFCEFYFDGMVRTHGGIAHKTDRFRVQFDYLFFLDVSRLEAKLVGYVDRTEITCNAVCLFQSDVPSGTILFFGEQKELEPIEPTLENAMKILNQISNIQRLKNAKAEV